MKAGNAIYKRSDVVKFFNVGKLEMLFKLGVNEQTCNPNQLNLPYLCFLFTVLTEYS